MSLQLDVYDQAVDAVPNMFEVVFHGLPLFVGDSSGDSANLDGRPYQGLKDGVPCLRVKKFAVPQTGVTVKNISYMGAIIKVPLAKLELDPTFPLEFRVDQHWQIYRDICTWRNKVGDPNSARIGMDTFNIVTNKLTGTRCDSVEVRTLPREHEGAFRPLRWTFNFAYPYKVSGVELDFSATDPISVTVDFGYLFQKETFADELYSADFKDQWKKNWA